MRVGVGAVVWAFGWAAVWAGVGAVVVGVAGVAGVADVDAVAPLLVGGRAVGLEMLTAVAVLAAPGRDECGGGVCGAAVPVCGAELEGTHSRIVS